MHPGRFGRMWYSGRVMGRFRSLTTGSRGRITERGSMALDEAEHGFDIFKDKQDNCEKVVLKP